jgi:hypothetical protein
MLYQVKDGRLYIYLYIIIWQPTIQLFLLAVYPVLFSTMSVTKMLEISMKAHKVWKTTTSTKSIIANYSIILRIEEQIKMYESFKSVRKKLNAVIQVQRV